MASNDKKKDAGSSDPNNPVRNTFVRISSDTGEPVAAEQKDVAARDAAGQKETVARGAAEQKETEDRTAVERKETEDRPPAGDVADGVVAAAPRIITPKCDTDSFNTLIAAFANSPLEDPINEAAVLYKNAHFYYTCGQNVGALVSYSCAAVLLNNINRTSATNEIVIQQKTTIDNIMACCLSAVKDLQGKVGTNSSSKKNDDDEEEKDWDKVCVKHTPLMFKKGSSDCIFFDDVAGLSKEKKILEYSLVYPLVYPNLYPKASKGILIYGPPGTGKTFLVKAAVNYLQLIAPNVGVLFFAPSPGDLKGKFVGETEKRIEEVFRCASKAACKYEDACKKKYISIVFMDEMDAIGPNRDTDTTGLAVNSVNTLLQMMDGVQSASNVAVVAATNYPWNLDGAILRRFDTQVLINLSPENDIKQLLNMEINRMIDLSKDKSDFNYCETMKKSPTGKTGDKKEEPLICKLQCEKETKQELRFKAPYDQLKIDYYTESGKGGLIDGIVNKLYQSHFSNSDIGRLLKTAATNAGQLAVKANLFYSTELLNDFNNKKYISCLTKLKNDDIAITKSIEIINSFTNNQLPAYLYQINPPKITNITFNNDTYWNIKCLFHKNESVFLLDDPSIEDIYIKYNLNANPQANIANIASYKRDVLGVANEIDMIISFKYIIKTTANNQNVSLLPVSSNLINGVFKPLTELFETIKDNLTKDTIIDNTDTRPAGGGPVTDQIKSTYNLNAGEDKTIIGGQMFATNAVANAPLEFTPAVKNIIENPVYIEAVNNSITTNKNIKFYKLATHNITFLIYLKLIKALDPNENPDAADPAIVIMMDKYVNDSIPFEMSIQQQGQEAVVINENISNISIRTFKTKFTDIEYPIYYDTVTKNYSLSVNWFLDLINGRRLDADAAKGIPIYDEVIADILGVGFVVNNYFSEDFNKRTLIIEESSFSLMFYYQFESNNYLTEPTLDDNTCYTSPASKMIQLYIDDIYKYQQVAITMGTADATTKFKAYLVSIMKTTNKTDLVTEICRRIYDNYIFVKTQGGPQGQGQGPPGGQDDDDDDADQGNFPAERPAPKDYSADEGEELLNYIAKYVNEQVEEYYGKDDLKKYNTPISKFLNSRDATRKQPLTQVLNFIQAIKDTKLLDAFEAIQRVIKKPDINDNLDLYWGFLLLYFSVNNAQKVQLKTRPFRINNVSYYELDSDLIKQVLNVFLAQMSQNSNQARENLVNFINCVFVANYKPNAWIETREYESKKGRGGGSSSSKTVKRKIKKFKNKTMSSRNIQPSKTQITEVDDDVHMMSGGADSPAMEGFKKFCINKYVAVVKESVIEKQMFIKTKFNFAALTSEQIRGGIFKFLWHDLGPGLRTVARKVGTLAGVWTKEEGDAYVAQLAEEIRKDNEQANLLLPLIFKNVAAVGFLVTADPRDKTIVDDKCNKLAWIQLGSGSWMYKSLGFVVKSLLATPSESSPGLSFENLMRPLFAIIGPGALNIYLGPLGLVPAIIANIRNAVYSQQTQDDIVNNILLMQIIT
ncbi:MAG: AAA family ATPase, partial [Candidatus Marinimicrobia bacterium]|nr:AAA family ATPase [Candidatus Neomarinimicrobiota bacterium]